MWGESIPLFSGKTLAIHGAAESRSDRVSEVFAVFVCACWQRLGGGPGVMVAFLTLVIARCFLEISKSLTTTV